MIFPFLLLSPSLSSCCNITVDQNTEAIDYPLHEASKRGNITFMRECISNNVSGPWDSINLDHEKWRIYCYVLLAVLLIDMKLLNNIFFFFFLDDRLGTCNIIKIMPLVVYCLVSDLKILHSCGGITISGEGPQN